MTIHEPDINNSAGENAKTGQVWPDWHPRLNKFSSSSRLEASWQLLNTLIPYFCLWYLMVRSIQLGNSYIWTLILAIFSLIWLAPCGALRNEAKAEQGFFTADFKRSDVKWKQLGKI